MRVAPGQVHQNVFNKRICVGAIYKRGQRAAQFRRMGETCRKIGKAPGQGRHQRPGGLLTGAWRNVAELHIEGLIRKAGGAQPVAGYLEIGYKPLLIYHHLRLGRGHLEVFSRAGPHVGNAQTKREQLGGFHLRGGGIVAENLKRQYVLKAQQGLRFNGDNGRDGSGLARHAAGIVGHAGHGIVAYPGCRRAAGPGRRDN